MTINPVPYPIFLAQGLTQYVSQLSPGIVPVAVLKTNSATGATALQVQAAGASPSSAQNVAAATPFIADTVISFNDSTGEKKVVVDHVDLTTTPLAPGDPTIYPTIYLKFEGRDSPGLQFAHAAGSTIVTNLFRTYLGERVNSSLDNGYPIIGIWVMNNAKAWVRNQQWQNQAVASVLYRLQAKQPEGPKLHPQIWLEETLDRAEYDTQALVQGLQVNSAIRVNGTSYAFLVTQFITARRDSLADANPVFEFLVDIHVQGIFDPTN